MHCAEAKRIDFDVKIAPNQIAHVRVVDYDGFSRSREHFEFLDTVTQTCLADKCQLRFQNQYSTVYISVLSNYGPILRNNGFLIHGRIRCPVTGQFQTTPVCNPRGTLRLCDPKSFCDCCAYRQCIDLVQ